MQNKRYCNHCGKELDKKAHGRRKYCSDLCKREQFRMRVGLPKTAHGEHYTFWKELHACSLEELQVLFGKRKREIKYAKTLHERLKLKKELKIISMVYEKLVTLC